MAVQSSGHIPCPLCGYFHSEYLTCEAARETGRRIQPPHGAAMPGNPVGPTTPPVAFPNSPMCRFCQNKHPESMDCGRASVIDNEVRAGWYSSRRAERQAAALSLWLTDGVRLASRRHDGTARLDAQLARLHPS